jgi:hypothetical protein
MRILRDALNVTLAAALALAGVGSAQAAIARFHFVPSGNDGRMTLAPAGPGERINVFGRSPDAQAPRPTVVVSYQHPFSGQTVSVPLRLPPDNPQILHRGNRIIYDYSGYQVQVEFLRDGSVDVIYNSGLFRAL